MFILKSSLPFTVVWCQKGHSYMVQRLTELRTFIGTIHAVVKSQCWPCFYSDYSSLVSLEVSYGPLAVWIHVPTNSNRTKKHQYPVPLRIFVEGLIQVQEELVSLLSCYPFANVRILSNSMKRSRSEERLYVYTLIIISHLAHSFVAFNCLFEQIFYLRHAMYYLNCLGLSMWGLTPLQRYEIISFQIHLILCLTRDRSLFCWYL